MPEGPEIRRTADALARVLVARTLTGAEYRVPTLVRKARRLRGARVTSVRSRGKALLIAFDCGLTHYSHNQLYGEWAVVARHEPRTDARAVRVVLATAAHTATLYSATDIALLDDAGLVRHPYLAGLGPDLLDRSTTPALLLARLRDPRFARRSLASLLLDQRFVAGVGNYLRSEILFAARLPFDLTPSQLAPAQCANLVKAIRSLARQSYRTGGVTNDPARARAARKAGVAFEDYRFLVYHREGAPCRACGARVQRCDAAGRPLFRCPRCQGDRLRKV